MKLTTAILLAASLASAATLSDSLKAGKAGLQSAGPIAFGPEGILFVGDTKGAAIFAFDTGDRQPNKAAAPVDLEGLGGKIGALVGAPAASVPWARDVSNSPPMRRVGSLPVGRAPWPAPWPGAPHVLLKNSR